MKRLLLFLLLLPQLCFGQAAYDTRVMLQNSTNTGVVTRFVTPPPGFANGTLNIIGNPSGYPELVFSSFGTGISFDSVNKTLSVSGPASMITDFTSVSNGLINAALASYSTTATMNSALAGKMDIPSGSSTTYLRGDNVWATSPTDLGNFSNGPGYITNSTNGLTNYTTTTNLNSALSGKFNNPTGTSSQFLKGDGTYGTIITAVSGLTNDVPYVSSSSLSSTLSGYPTNASLSSTLSSYVTNSSLTSTLGSYVTSSGLSSTLGSYATTSALTSGLSGKFNTPSGTTSQYIRGDGSLQTFPSIPSAQVNSDWNSVSGVSQILNKPTIPAAQVNSDWNSVSGLSQILNKPNIPAAQVQSDWNAVSGLGVILNKPSIASSATAPITLNSGVIAIDPATTSSAGSLSSGDKQKIDGMVSPSSWTYTTPTFNSSTTATRLSTTRPTYVKYGYDSNVVISLLAGQSITAVLKYADDSSMSVNVVLLDSAKTANSGVLNLSQTNTLQVSGYVPPNKYRQVTFVTTGSGVSAPSSLAAGQEIVQ